MEENLHKDNLEEFFKNSIKNAGDAPAADGWDVPSDKVWDGVNASINPPANPAFLFNWKWLGAILLGVILVGVLYYNYSLNQQIDTLTEAIEENKSQIENLKKGEDSNFKTPIPNSNTDESLTKDSSLSEEDRVKTSEASADEYQASIDQLAILNNTKSKPVSGRPAPEQKEFVPNETQADKSLNESESETLNDASGESNDPIATQDKDDQGTSKEQSLKEESTPNTNLSNNQKKEIAENTSKTEAATDQTTGKKEKEIEDPIDRITHSNQVNDTDESKEISENGALSPDSSGVTQLPLNDESHKEAAKEIADNQEVTIEKMDSISVAETPQNLEEQPSLETKHHKGFYLGAHLAPTYAYREIQLANNNPILRKLLNEQEKADYSYSFGIKAGYQLSKNWSVESGVDYSKATIMSRHRKQIQHRQENEMQGADGFESDHNLTLNTSYGDIETDVAVTRASDATISQNDFIGLRINTRQDISYVRIPLILKFKTAGDKKLHFSARAGLMNSFVVKRDVQIRAAALERPGVVLRKTTLRKNFSGFKKSSIDMLFGIGLEYDVTSKLGVYLEPTITRSISPVFERGPIKTYPVITTFNVGLSYKF